MARAEWVEVAHSWGIKKRELLEHIRGYVEKQGYAIVTAEKFMNDYYMAVRPIEGGDVFALAARFVMKEDGPARFFVRREGQGNRLRCCPDSVLDALTPTDDPAANKWRDNARAHNRRRREAGKVWDTPTHRGE